MPLGSLHFFNILGMVVKQFLRNQKFIRSNRADRFYNFVTLIFLSSSFKCSSAFHPCLSEIYSLVQNLVPIVKTWRGPIKGIHRSFKGRQGRMCGTIGASRPSSSLLRSWWGWKHLALIQYESYSYISSRTTIKRREGGIRLRQTWEETMQEERSATMTTRELPMHEYHTYEMSYKSELSWSKSSLFQLVSILFFHKLLCFLKAKLCQI